jgi:hypothetical protein
MGKKKNSSQIFKKAFDFLVKHYNSPESFSKAEFVEFIGDPNINTYFSKKYRHLLQDDPNKKNKFFVSPVFKKYSSFDKFRKHASQSTRVQGNYSEEFYKNILIFEFFLPLNNESALRSALDDLFYKDTIELIFKKINEKHIKQAFPQKENEKEDIYLNRLYDWISYRFGGYSIDTVYGRYKSDELKSFKDVAELLSSGRQYLIDETTAIVRFIFHIGEPIKSEFVNYDFDQFILKQTKIENESAINEEINQIRFFFKNLFVKTILTLVEGEDEIWMIERGIRSPPRLFIWKSITE